MDVEGDDELARLARSFNTTLDELEQSVAAQRHLVADAGHELRTPIASIRANIDDCSLASSRALCVWQILLRYGVGIALDRESDHDARDNPM